MNFRFRHGDRPLAGHTILRGVGRGGFGEVYFAVTDGGREVALKTILQNSEIELRGVKHCINLKSQHLVSIFDVRTTDEGIPCVIMEYVAGPNLREILREHPKGLGPERAAFLVREIARGLAYLHECGIVHRDLKPENIFYEDGCVKIGDYGLSKYISVSRQSGQTISVGTVHYMAPEVGSGNYSASIDIYALGIILFELLTGRVPFTGDSFGEILMKHLTAEPVLDGIEDPFRAVIARALRKKPDERYANVEDMTRDLLRHEDLARSVHLFNPASLSVAAGRAAARGIAPADTRPPPPAAAPARDGGPAAPRAPHLDRERPAAGALAPPRPAPPAAERPALAPVADELDWMQRGARAAFAIAAMTLLVGFFALRDHNRIEMMMGLVVASASGTAAVLATERWLAGRIKVSHGLWWRALAAVVALPGVAIGCQSFRDPGGAVAAILIGFLVVDWRTRVLPRREARVDFHAAFTSGLAGLVAGFFFERGAPFFPAGALAAVSLAVNALSPFSSRSRARPAPSPATAPPVPLAQPAPRAPVPAARTNVTAPPVSRAPLTQRSWTLPPSPAAKVFWLMVAATLLAAALSCSLAPLVERFRPQEAIGFLGFALPLFGYTGFALYRGLWARRPSFWRRTLLPFVLTTTTNLAVTSGVLYFAGPAVGAWRIGREEGWVALGLFIAGVVTTGFFWSVDRLLLPQMNDWQELPNVPWSERPVHPLPRFIQLLLAAALVPTGIALFAAAVAHDPWEKLGFTLAGTIVSSCGFFFFHRGLRRRRGSLWEGLARPFVLTASATTIACLALYVSFSPDRRWARHTNPWNALGSLSGEEKLVVLILFTAAAVFGGFALCLRERRPTPALNAADPARAGWAAMASFLWMLGVVAALLGAALPTGAIDDLRVEQALGLPGHGAQLLFSLAMGLVAVGSLCLVVSRRHHGAAHVLRALVGLLALSAAVFALFPVGGAVRFTADRQLAIAEPTTALRPWIATMVACGIAGVLLLLWPRRARERQPLVNPHEALIGS